METKKYTRLTLSERVKIETLIGEKKSKTHISEQLGRSCSTISNELNKWKSSRFYYNAELANEYAIYLNMTTAVFTHKNNESQIESFKRHKTLSKIHYD